MGRAGLSVVWCCICQRPAKEAYGFFCSVGCEKIMVRCHGSFDEVHLPTDYAHPEHGQYLVAFADRAAPAYLLDGH